MHWSTEQSPSTSTTGRSSAGTSRGSTKLGGGLGAAERFQRPHAASDQIRDDGHDQALRQPVAAFGFRSSRARCHFAPRVRGVHFAPRVRGTGSTPSDVSSTASALTGPLGKSRARGTAPGGA